MKKTDLWAIINLSPDSFYAPSHKNVSEAMQVAADFFAAGASVVDVGAESTKPGAKPVAADTQLASLLPFLERMEAKARTKVSIDTRHPEVAAKVLVTGVGFINDVSGGSDAMYRIIGETNAGYVLTHSKGDPETMQKNPEYDDVVAEVEAFFLERTAKLESLGARKSQIIWDAGIGFGKTVEHNLKLLAAYPRFAQHGYRTLAGVSRKSFIGKILNQTDPANRLVGTIAAQIYLTLRGLDILRVHDVKEMAECLTILEALDAHDTPALSSPKDVSKHSY